jgi:hypothetical protein
MAKQPTFIRSASEFSLVASENHLKTVKVKTIETLEPKQFCRLMFGLDCFNESDIQEIEQTSEYVKKARLLICQVLGLRWDNVRNWGRNFQKKVPKQYKRTLWLYWQLYKNEKKQEDELLVC